MVFSPSPSVQDYWIGRRSVGGPFWDIDFLVFDRILNEQKRSGVTGDLLEIGALYGKSAIVLGLHAQPGEETVICDLFGDTGVNAANTHENEMSYPGLNRGIFEDNYKRWVSRPARVVQHLSDEIRSHVRDGSLRFAHVDGGHHYDVVAADIRNCRELLADGGIIVIDDFRQIHTPGVAAAAWAAVANDGLIPFCATEQKLYATWDAATADSMLKELTTWVRSEDAITNAGIQDVAGHQLLIIQNPVGTTSRERVRRALPPALLSALRGASKPYLGRPL